MIDKVMTLFVVEGPAGSGKSVLIETLKPVWKELPRLGQFPRPRAYTGEDGIKLSQAKDAMTMLALAWSNEQKNVVDRFLISQWVYGSIRRGEPLRSETGSELLKCCLNRGQTELREKNARSFKVGAKWYAYLDLQFIIMMPSVEMLKLQRKGSPKEYIYKASSEIEGYRDAAEMLFVLGVDVRVVQFDTLAERTMKVKEVYASVESYTGPIP